jgi:YfiH family protein
MFITYKADNGVCFVTSDILKSRHAFSTRIGGVSREAHTAGLNLAFNRGDSDETVLFNLAAFGEAVGFDPESVISLPQIHSATVLEVDGGFRGLGYYNKTQLSADGYATAKKNVTLGVKSADCVPILLEAEDGEGNITAVSALHAGWRGTVAGIAEEGVKRLVQLGADPARIRAAIGPAIGSCCFRVGEDFKETVTSERGGDFAKRFIREENGQLFADIKAMNRELLASCGLENKNIDVCQECTFCLGSKYYSHRRMAGLRGTMLSVITLD